MKSNQMNFNNFHVMKKLLDVIYLFIIITVSQSYNKIIKKTTASIIICSCTFLNYPQYVLASSNDIIKGKQIFETSCIGCHENGGNLLKRSKTLTIKNLQQDNYNDINNMIILINKGKGQMPPYSSFTSPKGNIMPAKLSDDDISNVASYVIDQATNGW